MFGARNNERIAALTEYYAKLRLSYGGDGKSKHWLYGPYRGLALHVFCKRGRSGYENTGTSPYNELRDSYRPLYGDYLQVDCPINATPQLVIFHRKERAIPCTGGYTKLPDGTQHFNASEDFAGYN